MPAFITNTVHIQRYADAVYGVQVGSATLAQINQDIISLGGIDKALNAYFAGAGQTNATVAANIVKNVGIVVGGTITAAAVTDATAYVLGQLNANKGNEGATIKNILNLVGNLTADPIYGAAAVKFNADVDNAIAYTGASDFAIGSVVSSGAAFTLTTGVDTPTNATLVNGVIDFAGGNLVGAASTLNAGDRITGTSGTADTLNVTLQNTNGTGIGAGTQTAVQQVITMSVPVPTAAVVNTVSYGGVTTNVATGTTSTTHGDALAAAINQSAGQVIAVFTAAANPATTAGSLVITAPVAGVALPAITTSAALVANNPTSTFTTANVTASSAVPLSLGVLSGIEIVNIQNSSSSSATLSGSAAPGALQLNAANSVGAVLFTDVARTAAIGVSGDGSGTVRGAVTGTYVPTATSGALNVSGGVTAGPATVAAANATMTSVNVNSTGGAQAATAGQVNTVAGLTLTGAGIATLNIDAATSLSLGTPAITSASLININAKGAATTVSLGGALPSNVVSVDGSGLTAGGVTATLGAGVTSFKGGAGVDTITTAATTAAGAVIDGGAGAADILNLAAINDVTTAAKAAQYTGFEVLRNTQTTAVDMALFSGYTSVQTNGVNGGFTNMTAGQAGAITNRVNHTAVTFSLANSTGANDVLSVTLNNGTTTTGPVTSADLAGATVNGFETMNVISSSGVAADINALSFASGGAADLTALNISGAKPLSLSTTNLAKSIAIDSSSLSYVGATATDYSLTITGNLIKGSSVTSTGSQDSITTTAAVTGTTGEFVTYNAGAGNDLISTTLGAVNNTSAANASIKVNGGLGRDTLTFSDTAATTIIDNNFQYITGIEIINVVATGNNAVSLTSGGFFDSNFKTDGITLNVSAGGTTTTANTVNLATFTGNATISLDARNATTGIQTVNGGSGNDVITVLLTAQTSGASVISGGAGNDTINVTVGGTTTVAAPVVNGGIGKDSIVLTGAAAQAVIQTMTIAVGEGTSTVAAPDSVAGAKLGTTAGTLFGTLFDFDGTATVASDVASTASSVANVNYAITTGLMTFTGTGAATLSASQKAAIAQAVVTVADKAVVFTDGTDSYVFHNGATAANAGDSLVQLVGLTALGAGVAGASAAAVTGYVFIG